MAFNPSRVKILILSFVGFAFLAGLFGYHSFVNAKCTAYPWWYGQGSDGDGIYMTQTLALLNNGDLTFVFHPGGTVFAAHGAVYRTLSLFLKPYALLTQLDKLPNPSAAFALMDLAMNASRVLTYFVYLCALVIFWILLSRLTRSRLLAFFLAAFFMTAPHMLYPLYFIRPELFTFIFCIAMLLIVLRDGQKEKELLFTQALWGVLAGICAGLAMFAKIQVLPEIFGVFVLYLLRRNGLRGAIAIKKTAIFAVFISLFNFLIMPWGWLLRPGLLTDAYLGHFYPGEEKLRIYGPVPHTLAPLFASILGGVLLISLIVFLKCQVWPRVAQMALKINLMVSGMIVSSYVVFMPLGMNHHSYEAASNHLLYATMTNIIYGAFLEHKVTWDTLHNIIGLHASSQLFGLSILRYVTVAALGSLVRIFLKTTSDKRPYYGVLAFFAFGFMMDVISSMRWEGNRIISSYAIYSLSCHVLGLGLWLAAECQRFRRRFGLDLRIMICALLAVHLIGRTIFFINHPKASGEVTGQDPKQEMLNTMSHVRPFWTIISHGQL